MKNKLHLYMGNLRDSGQLFFSAALFCQLPLLWMQVEAWTLLSIKKFNGEDQLPLHLPRDQSFGALFFFFFPWKTSRAKLRSDNGYVVEKPTLPWEVADLWWVIFFPSQFEENNRSRRCMPPQGEVKHLLRGGLRSDSWGNLVTPATVMSLIGSSQMWHGSIGLGACSGRNVLPGSLLSMESGCHKPHMGQITFCSTISDQKNG